MNIKLFKQKGTDGINIILMLDNGYSFLLSNQYHFVLSWESYRTTIFDKEIELYELSFNEELKDFIISKVIKGIFQYRLLSIPSIFISFKSEIEYKNKYRKIKELYKELKKINITKKLTFKEKLITLLLV